MRSIVKIALLVTILVIIGSGAFAIYSVFWGFRDAAVPNLEGMKVADAASLIEGKGIKLRIDEVDSVQPEGTIVEQWPKAGSMVKKGQIVILKVSRGGARLPLPDVRGMEYGQCVTLLKEKGFVVGEIVRIHSNARPAGVVIAQSPAAPALVPQNKPIDLLVSLGPSRVDGKVKIPNVLDRSEKIARQILGQSGLRVGAVKFRYTLLTPPGMVMDMAPRPGVEVAEGSSVVLYVATSKKPSTPEKKTVLKEPKKEPEKIESVVSNSEPSKVEKEEESAGAPTSVTSTGSPSGQESKESTKIAKIRYQVPPLAKPMELKIELIDKKGVKTILKRQVNSGEYISIDAPFVGDAAVTIYLGGQFVWQDRYR